jgi:MFS transporter, ACS family, tartrate transporter
MLVLSRRAARRALPTIRYAKFLYTCMNSVSSAQQSLPITNLAERTRQKVHRRLIPFFLLLYTIAYLDRVNLSYASLDMTKELHISNSVYGLGAGIFFLGYFLLEIPGAVLVERWSARKWISRIMISWGLIASLTGLVHTQGQFLSVRFFLGVAEAGFFPGMAVYITHWFKRSDRAKALAGMLVGYPIAQIVGAPLSAALMNLHWLGWAGWRWVLVWEGIPAIAAGIWVLFYLPDHPKDAKWLTSEEQRWTIDELKQENQTLSDKQVSPWQVIWRPEVIALTAIWFLGSGNTLTLWLPKFIQGMTGYSSIATTIASTVPFLAALPFTLLIGWNSDRTGERRWHTAICIFLAAAGLALSQATAIIPLGILGLTIATMGTSARQAPFWSVSSSLLTGTSSAVAIAIISSFGQLGSFVGPYIIGFLSDLTGTYAAGTYYLIGSYVVAGMIMLFLKPPNRRQSFSS